MRGDGTGTALTPVGAATISGALATILFYFIGLIPHWASLPGQVQGAVQTLVTAVLVYLGGWFNVVRSKGQRVELALTAGALPTVQAAPAEAPAGGEPAGTPG